MIDYIKSLLPQLQQYSKNLNDTAIFADVPWGFIDEDNDRVTYIFRRNNELLVSKRGDVTTGHWEYLSVMQSLLIEHANRKRMYNQGFIDNAVMALKKDGTDELFWLANQQILPDLNVVGYLEQKVQSAVPASNSSLPNRFNIQLINPVRLILVEAIRDGVEYSLYENGNKVFDGKTGSPLEDGTFHTNSGFIIEVKNGTINKTSASGDYLFIVGLVFMVILIIILLAIRSAI